jgi:hypothetical protein
MANNEPMESASSEALNFAKETWIVVWEQSIAEDGTFPLGAIAELEFVNPQPQGKRFVPLFTTAELAKRFIAQRRADRRGALRAVPCQGHEAVEKLFEALVLIGTKLVAFDPGADRVDAKLTVDVFQLIKKGKELG